MTIAKYALSEIPLQRLKDPLNVFGHTVTLDEFGQLTSQLEGQITFKLPVEHGHLTRLYEPGCPVYSTEDGEIFLLPRDIKGSLKQAEIKLRPNQIIHSFLITRYRAIYDLIEAIFSKNKVYLERYGDLSGDVVCSNIFSAISHYIIGTPDLGGMGGGVGMAVDFPGSQMMEAPPGRHYIRVMWGAPPVGVVWGNYKDNDDIRNVFLNRLIGRYKIDEKQEAVRPPMPVNKEYGNLTLVELVRKHDTYLRIEQVYSNVYELYPEMVHKFNSELMEIINKLALTRFFYLPGEQHEAAADEEFSISNCIQILNREPIFRKGFEDMWKKVSGMFELKLELFFKVFCPIYDSSFKTKYKQTPLNGVLFYGPPGCGKTHIAKAVANSLNAEFIDYSPGSHGSKYQNETSNKIQLLFDQAKVRYKSGKRTVIFVDEADSVFPRRDRLSDNSEKKDSVEQFLRNMESCNEFGVLVICATNFRDNLDPASIRAGRIDLEFELLAPSIETRRDLYEKEIKGCSCLSADVDLDCLVDLTDKFPSSSIKNVVLNALNCAARIGSDVSMIHFKKAIEEERQRLI
ncbi:MAG: Proteasome-associated ATPase [Candidatus Anoxychlamydiales bacterium]|nr:Proteasome-associated ATPase [Candidatus Anoxychlamydiales bacterium]